MGKAKAPRQLKDNEAQAVARTLRVSPQKLNLVASMIRGKKVNAALVDALIVAEAYVGKSIVMKRFHVRGRGRASRIEKPFSHLTIVVREVAEKGEAA